MDLYLVIRQFIVGGIFGGAQIISMYTDLTAAQNDATSSVGEQCDVTLVKIPTTLLSSTTVMPPPPATPTPQPPAPTPQPSPTPSPTPITPVPPIE